MKQNLYQRFPKRLTRWLRKSQLDSCKTLFFKYHGDCEGVEFIVKSNRKKIKPKFAIFIKEENRLRRVNDLPIITKIKFIDLLMMVKPDKKEGIPLLTTLGKRF